MVSMAVGSFESVLLSVLSELWKWFSRVGCMSIRVTGFIVLSDGLWKLLSYVRCMLIRVTRFIVLSDELWNLLSRVGCMPIKVLQVLLYCLMNCRSCYLM